jgi:hypothetical protein
MFATQSESMLGEGNLTCGAHWKCKNWYHRPFNSLAFDLSLDSKEVSNELPSPPATLH